MAKAQFNHLITAIRKNDVPTATHLIENMSSQDLQQQTNRNNETALLVASYEGMIDIVKLLINKCPDIITTPNKWGQTPLHIAYDYEIAKTLISKEPSLFYVLDVDGDNFLHSEASRGDNNFVQNVFDDTDLVEVLGGLINQRNYKGTTPLGAFFLNKKIVKVNLLNIAKLFVEQDTLEINTYLNNKKGMNYDAAELIQLGGFNILHVALINGYEEILDLLKIRNDKLSWSSEHAVNFSYPSLNPRHHMNSPLKLLALYPNQALKTKLSILQSKANEYDNDSGDSDIENTPAFSYKLALTQLSSISDTYPIVAEDEQKEGDGLNFSIKRHVQQRCNALKKQQSDVAKALITNDVMQGRDPLNATPQEKGQITRKFNKWKPSAEEKQAIRNEEAQAREEAEITQNGYINNQSSRADLMAHYQSIVIPHFHGVPFMFGQYTNNERREVACKFLALNPKEPEEEGKELEGEFSLALHSRTSMASNGMENLHYLIKASSTEVSKVKATDKILNRFLVDTYKFREELFFNTIKTYVYDFSKDPWKDGAYDSSKDPIVKYWNALGVPQDLVDIIKYRFPFISTSKTPQHPVGFGIGAMVETQSKGELPIEPKYNSDGFPQHRLAGFLFITIHTLNDFDKMEYCKQLVDMTKLVKIKHNGFRSSSPHIDQQLEVTFFGGIDEKNVVAAIPMIYPNFKKGFIPEYHGKVWGLTNIKFNQFKAELEANKDTLSIELQDSILIGLTNFALKVCYAIAKTGNQKLYYSTPVNEIKPWCYGWYNNNTLLVQKDIRDYIYTGTGANQEKLHDEVVADDSIRCILSGEVLQDGFVQ